MHIPQDSNPFAHAPLLEALTAAGFLALGGFVPEPVDRIVDPSTDAEATFLLLVGSTGPTLWPVLMTSAEGADGLADPMDRYTRRTLSAIAGEFDVQPVFPFDGPPYHPFQQWALRCGGFSQSPIGVLAHHAYGPWAGFRAALLFFEAPGTIVGTVGEGPCVTCREKPCLSACPVEAFSAETGYDVPACRDHLRSDATVTCWSGCLARRACPFGTEHAPSPENARFHMKTFTGM